jgi:hypothetical protein
MELHQVSNEVVIQQAHITAHNKASIKARMQRLVKVDVEMRARWLRQTSLQQWRLAVARRRFLRCQHRRIAARRQASIMWEAMLAWREQVLRLA